MQIIFSLFTNNPYIDLPSHLLGWAGWFILLALLVWGFLHWWEPKPIRTNGQWFLALSLIFLVPLTMLFLGARLPDQNALPMPGGLVERSTPAMMFLSAIPFVLAASIFGPSPGALVGLFSGLLLAIWDTHSLFTPLELSGLALLFGACVRQRYRTPTYRFLRHPFGAALFLALTYAPVYILASFFAVRGSLAVRIDYALTQTWLIVIANGVSLLIAGLFTEVLYLTHISPWSRPLDLIPSPSEKNLSLRFLYTTGPLVLVLVLTLMVSDWVVAGNAARSMIENRLSSTSEVASQSLPYFLETGQNLIQNLSKEGLYSLSHDQAIGALAQRLRSIPYFRQLYVFDQNGQPLAGYPLDDFEQVRPSEQERAGIQLALRGVPIQTYTIRPWPGETTAQISFIAVINDAFGTPRGVLLGRTDLNSNPFTQPAIQALETIHSIGGEGMILDENGYILYHPVANLVMTQYYGRLPDAREFYQDTSPSGTRQYSYYMPVIGRPWAVVLTVPAEQAQQMALDIAVPLLGMLIFLALVAFLILRLSLRSVTQSLSGLAGEATLISQGQLDHPLQIQGVDEVGQFGRAFEQMRVSLKARLEDLNRLLMVSQGVATHLEASQAVQPILQAALGDKASSARVVLVRDVTLDPRQEKPVGYGCGPSTERFAYLDAQIFDMMRQQDLITIPNTQRLKRLSIPPGNPQPGSVLALPLHHENVYYGALWVAYDDPHTIWDEEIRFLTTLAGQAALAAGNARLYATAEIGRQRLEAMLASTPEPVFVIDQQMRLLLLNPAALQIPGLVVATGPGRHIKDVIFNADLLELVLAETAEGVSSREISMQNNRVYFASVSPVQGEGRHLGKICILRDITHYKQLDMLKSDFVSTVSHDLRSPLTLMRGYATMLQMVGELNDQQKGYVRKIVTGVENMTRLVNNLLDLGRIEAGIGLQISKFSVYEVVDRVMNALMPQATQKNIQLIHERPEDPSVLQPILIQADSALLEQAIYNLIENAIKYTQVGGKVNIEVQLRPATVVFEVRDTGIGIAPLDLPHMFEKFYRSGRREAYSQRGTGLGLAIVKTIAERHGGRVWVESQLGKGSAFYLEVPFEPSEGEKSS